MSGAEAKRRFVVLAGGALALAAMAIVGAWVFEYGVGLVPCPLCLTQRQPYYWGIPIGLAGLVVAIVGGPRRVAIAGVGLFAIGMLIGAGLGIYHSGVEWGFWPGPTTCAVAEGGGAASVAELMRALGEARVVRCDEAAWRFLGLSLAGWNAVVSLAVAGLAAAGLRAYGSSSVSQ